jgi:hypothetical protein
MSSRAIISTGLRGSVVRLLNGDVRERDLHDLFFSMRAESGGRGLVSEIAHFIAHPDRRTHGIVVQDVRDFFAFAKLRAEIDNRSIITQMLPPTFHEAMQGNFRRMRTTILVKQTGLNRAQARPVLDRALSKVSLQRGAARLAPEEARVVDCVFRNLKGTSFFTDHDLFEDFCRIAEKLGLLFGDKEKSALRKSKAAFALFSLTVMHNKIIDLGNNDTATLGIAADKRRHLAVYAFSMVKGPGGRTPMMGQWLFETELPIAAYCEPTSIAPLSRHAFIGDFQMTPAMKLVHRT